LLRVVTQPSTYLSEKYDARQHFLFIYHVTDTFDFDGVPGTVAFTFVSAKFARQ
jgi:hypothetical protein